MYSSLLLSGEISNPEISTIKVDNVLFLQTTDMLQLYVSINSVLVKATLCRNLHFVHFGASQSSWVRHHCHKYKSLVCYSLTEAMELLTANKTHYVIKMLCDENIYVEISDLTLWLKLHSAETSDGGRSDWDRDTIHPVTRHWTINMV